MQPKNPAPLLIVIASYDASGNGKNDYDPCHPELLNDKSIDAVSVATPTFTHKDVVINALIKDDTVWLTQKAMAELLEKK